MGGLLINGAVVEVPGVQVIGPHDAEWSHLSPGDCRLRSRWPSQIILHRSMGDDPDKVLIGIGPPGGAERTARYWEEDIAHSGAHIVVGSDGVVACLADLALVEAYHATVSNLYSIGIELHEQPGGVLYQAQLDAAVAIVVAICAACSIQFQVPAMPYHGHPLTRMLDGGHDVTGVLGHRDNTESRGRWDPGEVIFSALRARGAQQFDFDSDHDLVFWREVQADLNSRGHGLVVDGVPGRLTATALKAEGYDGGILALGKTS